MLPLDENSPRCSEKLLIHRYQTDADICPSGYVAFKRWMDTCLAVIMLIPGLPIMVVLAVIIRRTSPGPVIFRQKRVGLHGRCFIIYKFRSMRVDAETDLGATWSEKDDPRVTRVGHWLRKLHLDELPQLLNVLKGEMSLVGPRPERPEFVGVLVDGIPGYMNRLAVLPGVTGLAQINLPPDDGIDSVRRKQVLDLEYIQNAGLWCDLRMLAATFLRIVGIRGDWAMRLMCVRREVVLESEESTKCFAPQKPTSIRELHVALDAVPPSDNGNGNGHDKEHVVVSAQLDERDESDEDSFILGRTAAGHS